MLQKKMFTSHTEASKWKIRMQALPHHYIAGKWGQLMLRLQCVQCAVSNPCSDFKFTTLRVSLCMIAVEVHWQSALAQSHIVLKRIQAMCQKKEELDENPLSAMARPRALPD